MEAILSKVVQAGDVVVIRYEGPQGGPGMREMLKPTSAIMGQGLGDQVAFITDGRFSGGTHGFVVGQRDRSIIDAGLKSPILRRIRQTAGRASGSRLHHTAAP